MPDPDDDDDVAWQAYLTVLQNRKDAYDSDHVVPGVPAAFSDDPEDPDFTFLGYTNVEPGEEGPENAELPPYEISPEEEDSIENDTIEDVTFILVNPVGETWAWKPSNATQLLADFRLQARGDADSLDAGPSEIGGEDVESPEIVFRGENVLGIDERFHRSIVNGFDMTAYPYRTVGPLVRTNYPENERPDVSCTATKVSPRLLVTAAHCLISNGTVHGRRLWPGADGLADDIGADPSPNVTKHIAWYVLDEHYTEHGWASRDFAVLVLLNNENSCDLGWLGYSNSVSWGSSVWGPGYPGENRICADSPRHDSKCYGSFYTQVKEVTRTDVPFVYYRLDTQGGMSGMGVYRNSNGDRRVIGIHRGGAGLSENRGVRLRKLVFDFIDATRSQHGSSYCGW